MIKCFHRGVAQLVARFVRDEEVGGSNPPTPTKSVVCVQSVLILASFSEFYYTPKL